jgi:dienelactone hydrolase
MPTTEAFALELGSATIDGLVTAPDGGGAAPTIVACHGFKGFMEWGFFPALAELLAARGFTVIRFNFSGAGMRPGEDRVADLAAFRGATLTKDVAELGGVIAATGERIATGRVDRDRLGLFGFSRGGGTALIEAAAADSPLRALVTWSAVAAFDRLTSAENAAWRERGEIVIENARTGQELPLGTEVLDDLEAHRRELDCAAAAGRRSMPWLIVHGEEDETVPVAEADAHAAAAAEPFELLRISGASHTYGAVHPFAGPTPHLIEAMNATQTWFRRHLGSP